MTESLGVYAHPEATLAFNVWEDHEGHSVIVWARHAMEAKRVGSSHLDLTYEDVECERYKALDGFQGDLLAWLLDDGWWFSCTECETQCSHDSQNVFLSEAGDVFCSEAHREKYQAHWLEKKTLEREFQRFAEIKFFGWRPHINFVNIGGDGYFSFDNAPPYDERRHFTAFITRAELGLPETPKI